MHLLKENGVIDKVCLERYVIGMEKATLITNGFLWVVAFIMMGIGLWKLRIGCRKLDVTEFTMKMKYIGQSKHMLLMQRKSFLAEDVSNTSEKVNAVRKLNGMIEKLSESYEGLANMGGQREGRGDIESVRATREITIAAASFALASIVIGVSALLITIFNS